MKRTATRRPRRSAQRRQRRPDRLTRLLMGMAIFLTVAILAISVDLWQSPVEGSRQAQPDSASQPPLSLVPTSIPDTPPPCTAPADWSVHVVRRGDTLYSLAQRYGTDVQTLERVNCLDNPTILIGQQLSVPGAGSLAVPTAVMEDSTPEPQGPDQEASPPELTAIAEVSGKVDIPESRLNILLLGTDIRPKRFNGTWRTDAIIVISVDSKDKSIRLLHIPRDLWVNIPGHGYDRINTAELWGELAKEGSGPDLVKETVSQNLGIPIDYYVQMTFDGFMSAVDALGGLDIPVDCPVTEIDLTPGVYHMDSKLVMEYIRQRKDSSDFDRGRRQRQVLMSVWEQALTPDIILKLPGLWVKLSDSYQTDLPLNRALALARLGLQIEPERIRSSAIDSRYVKDWITPEGAWVLLAREERLRDMLTEFYAPIDTTSLGKKGKPKAEVLNGTQLEDAEELAATALRRGGVKIRATGPAARPYEQTQIFIYKGDPAAGKRVAKILGVPATAIQDYTAIPEPPDRSNPVQIRVMLGSDYDPCQR